MATEKINVYLKGNIISKMRRLSVLICTFIAGASGLVYAAQDSLRSKMPPSIQESAREPIKYVGDVFCDKHYYDGRLRYAIGVHSYQAMRANRAKPPEGGMIGWTYNHQPYLCYWKGRFYLQYLSNLKEEHVPPGRTLIMVSNDGLSWSNPRVVFGKYPLPRIHKKYDDVGMVDLAEAILDKAVTEKVRPEWRARTFEMAEALYQSIRMQLSVKRYKGIRISRGANLDSIDVPLNDAEDMKKRFRSMRRLKTEDEQLRAIRKMVD